MSKRELFLQSVSKESVESFLNFIQLHKNNSDPFDLNEVLQEFPRKQRKALWERLKRLLANIILDNPVENWQEHEDSDDEMEVEGALDMKKNLSVISGITEVVVASVRAIDENDVYSDLLEIAIILNGILPALPTFQGDLKITIQHLFVAWWDKGLEGKEELGKTAFIMLLEKTLLGKFSNADILRLWHFHQALQNFDFNSEDNDEVKNSLLQCFMSIAHIKKEEGRRFLSFLFSWDVEFIKMIHGTIKNQLHHFPKSIMPFIAEVYFRAWKKASGVFLKTIEYSCIQDFMHHGVYLPKNSPVHSKVRELLSYFHQQKLRQGVDEMLHRLYQPILWRGLKARNSEVRANAAILFVEAFPIRDPGLSNEEVDIEIQRQFEEIFNLLEDPQPLVRSTGVLGVCRIAGNYWEMIPPSILTDLLTTVLRDLSADISSADVRCSVFKCLPVTLDNRMSHPLLEQLLPGLKNSLHDNSEKVRVAFVDMLLKIKAVRAAKFWKICPMEHLLARLELDSRPVARRIVNLLFNSFFPVNQPEEVWCERCVTLVQMNPMAARKFYQYAHEHTAPTNIAKMMLVIRRCLNACIARAVQNEDSGDDDEYQMGNSSVLDSVLSVNDSATMASLLEITVILWKSIYKALNQNKEAKNYTIAKFATAFPEYFKTFTDDCCTVPLVILASFMPATAVPTFSCGVLSKLRNLDKGADENRYSLLIDCLCQWGKVGHVLELITDWLTEGLPQKNKKTPQRTVRIQETMQPKLELALNFLEYILTNIMSRECLLSLPQKRLNQLLKALGAIKELLTSFLSASETILHDINVNTALKAFSLHCRLTIHFHNKFCTDDRTYLLALERNAGWIDKEVLQFLHVPGTEMETSEHQSDVARQVVEVYLTVSKDIIMVGASDIEFQAQFLGFALAVLQSGKGNFSLPIFMSILKEVTVNCLSQNIYSICENNNEILDIIQKVFHKVLEILARCSRRNQEEARQILESIQLVFGEFISTVHNWCGAHEAVHQDILSTMLAAMLAETIHSLKKKSDPEDVAPPETTDDLPLLSNYFLAIVLKCPGVIRSFLSELTECINSEAIQGVVGLVAALHILFLASKGKVKRAAIKNTAVAIHTKFQHYNGMISELSDIERALYTSSNSHLENLLQL
ncbi:condensin-2 complex subunit G2 isoform X1 [Scyliorhinus canicula]|uniref:condensin-2 complex subunit G2 isoform X1 n=2 Tax=Scyliorhinus canicula TaxID=7830 RepID=UPI0018F371FA|nr:condensin-2 complex subunit G2 isoform X1 [Scyliorhinus canicula]XP_038654295.1 condensin-2 complex subunit G2 isoform X1 [Scyliorhinus canicula]XP_038654296.1 condensin-2 complex subunit G2 isoform X1 [Scyliorhinus canicula]XP_038654297.1 condensin-2 complex subunit G2 isoform X1 [Scyliorhinus canicula]XP_038654298.1 condensin-2 complex subunit G2 isoform X1 [Scyliorhinus canicula]XP_038654299.1 condensin-2 complex subunit G2 isoform X1 [Scyliorhinus canicula]